MTLDLYGHLFPDRLGTRLAARWTLLLALTSPLFPKPVVVDLDAKRREATGQ